MKKSLMAALAACVISGTPVAAAPVQNEIMFMMDSSGGLYDPAYANWNAQIGWVQNFIDQTNRADGSNAYGIMTFSGLHPINFNYQQNINGGGVKVLHSLWAGATNPHPDGPLNPSSTQNPADLNDYTSGITDGDFLRAYTRTDDALTYVLNQFQTFSIGDTNKFIFILTDGGITPGFEPATATTVSPTLQAIRNDGITVGAVAVDISANNLGEFFEYVPSSPDLVFAVDGFNDFSDFLPEAQVVAMPAPPVLAFLAIGLAVIAVRRR